MAQITILGAGLTGLSAAYHLELQGFFDYEIFEKEETVGGLCRSVEQDGFTFDYTGHLLHINNDYMHACIKKIIGFDSFNFLHRKSKIFSHNVLTNYPFQTNLYGLPSFVIAECIQGYVIRKKINNPRSFYNWVSTHFGTGLGKHFFFPYQEKIFCYDLKKLTAQWTGRFVPKTSLAEMIEGAVKPNDTIGYNASFYYPKKGGIQNLINALAKQIIKPIHTMHNVETIDLAKKTITFSNGTHHVYQTIINTIPLDTLIQRIHDKGTTSYNHARGKLIKNSVYNLNLGIKKKNISDNHWIYIPEKKYPFYRLGFPHHFSPNNAPENTSSVYVECSYIGKQPQNLETTTFKKTLEFLSLDSSDILTQKALQLPHAYVIYNDWRNKHLPMLLARLQETGIYSVGRYGAWKYASMQESILDGKSIVDTLIMHDQPIKNIRTNEIKYNNSMVSNK